MPQGRANKCNQESMQHVLRFIKKELSCFSLQKYEPGSTLTPFRRALASLLRYDGSLILSLMIFCCNFCLLLCAKGGYNHEDDRISHQHWNQWHHMHKLTSLGIGRTNQLAKHWHPAGNTSAILAYLSCKHFIEQDTDRPPVGSFPMALCQHNLRCLNVHENAWALKYY